VAWLVQFRGRLSTNVLTEEEQQDGWTSTGRASLGYSFYFVLLSGVLHLANIVLIYCATKAPRRHTRQVIDKHPEGLIMLY
jgi:clarin